MLVSLVEVLILLNRNTIYKRSALKCYLSKSMYHQKNVLKVLKVKELKRITSLVSVMVLCII